MSTKRSLGQVVSIAFALSQDNQVHINEIKWLRNEIKKWFFNLFKF